MVIYLEQGANSLHCPADATTCKKPPSSLASFKSRLVLPFSYRLSQVDLENRPFNGCSGIGIGSSSSTVTLYFKL